MAREQNVNISIADLIINLPFPCGAEQISELVKWNQDPWRLREASVGVQSWPWAGGSWLPPAAWLGWCGLKIDLRMLGKKGAGGWRWLPALERRWESYLGSSPAILCCCSSFYEQHGVSCVCLPQHHPFVWGFFGASVGGWPQAGDVQS